VIAIAIVLVLEGLVATALPPLFALAIPASAVALALSLRAPRIVVLVTLAVYLPVAGLLRRATGTYVAKIDPLNLVGPAIAFLCLVFLLRQRGARPRTELNGAVGAMIVLGLVEAAAPVDAVEVVASEAAAMLGAEQVSFLIADLGGDSLIRFVRPAQHDEQPPGAAQRVETVALAGSPYERALVSQLIQVLPDGDRYRLYAPVADRGDALGVFELVVKERPDDTLLAKLVSAAHALAYVVIAGRRHTDLFDSVQRGAPFSLAAEIQHRLLPSAYTCEGKQFTLAGWLEPANHVGGDTFDYSVDRNLLHVSMTDAMGHGVKAAQLATLVVGSLRNSRRAEVGLVEQAKRANDDMTTYADQDQFVTGLLLRVDLYSGHVHVINAGHPQPYRVRGGQVSRLALEADLPFGMREGSTYRVQELQLEAGDRLVVVTDGLLERNAAVSHLDVVSALEKTAALHPREVVHVFKASVLAAADEELIDDASVLCIDWHGSTPPA